MTLMLEKFLSSSRLKVYVEFKLPSKISCNVIDIKELEVSIKSMVLRMLEIALIPLALLMKIGNSNSSSYFKIWAVKSPSVLTLIKYFI